MNYLQRAFLNSVKCCDENVLMMSRKNCHQIGLDSIVVDNINGKLTRAFFAHKNHQMWKNMNIKMPSLGIHDHKYDLKITSLFGLSLNICCKPLPHKKGMYMYQYSPEWKGGSGVSSRGVPCGLELKYVNEISIINIPHDQLHTVFVPMNRKAAWIVEEGNVVKNTTTLITHLKKNDIDLSNLYSEFESKDQIVSMVEEFLTDDGGLK